MRTTTRIYGLLASIALVLVFTGCGNGGGEGTGITDGTAVGVNGGTVTSADGKATLVIPPDALDRTVNIRIDPYTPQPGEPAAIPDTTYYFNPTGTQFALPLTLTVAYDLAQLPAGTDESALRIYKLHPDGTQDFAAGSVDVNAKTVTGEIRSFSVRGVGPAPVFGPCAIGLNGEYNPDRSVDLDWRLLRPPLGICEPPGNGYWRIERAKVVGRLTVYESGFAPLAYRLVNPAVPSTFTDRTIGNDAAIYFYRVRWSNNGQSIGQSVFGPPSNIEMITVFSQVGPPRASFIFSPASPTAGEIVTFDATASSDDGRIDNYFWDFEGDGVYDATGVTAQFSYATAGTYTARLRVVDDTGIGDETTRTVSVGQGSFILIVTVDRQGGFVGSTDGSFSCGVTGTSGSRTCTVQYAAGTVVDLYAAALPGTNVILESWQGDCAGFGAQPNISLTLNRDYTCRAVFTSAP